MNTTRREFNKLALTALPAMGLTVSSFAKPNSKFGGVQIGIIAPYSFRGLPSGADDLLKYYLSVEYGEQDDRRNKNERTPSVADEMTAHGGQCGEDAETDRDRGVTEAFESL